MVIYILIKIKSYKANLEKSGVSFTCKSLQLMNYVPRLFLESSTEMNILQVVKHIQL